MSDRQLDEFLNVRLPGKGYHAFDNGIELYSEKNLSFECVCGETHPVRSSFALIDFPLENKGLYFCPNNEHLFVLVKAKGLVSVKGLKVIASYEASDAGEKQKILASIESRKRRG